MDSPPRPVHNGEPCGVGGCGARRVLPYRAIIFDPKALSRCRRVYVEPVQKELKMKKLIGAAGAVALAVAFLATPVAASDKSQLLHDANQTVDNLKHDPAFA